MVSVALWVKAPATVRRREETSRVPAETVRAVVEAFAPRVLVPAARNSTEAKSVAEVFMVPERVCAVVLEKYTFPLLSVNKPLFA